MTLSIGHRGAAGYEPENTITAIRKAVEMDVDYVEVDVWRSADDDLVVMHDGYLDRTTDSSGSVEKYTVEELQQIDAGDGNGVPTLDDVIDEVGGEAGLFLELKGETASLAAEEVYRALEEGELSYGEVVVQSFYHMELQDFMKEMAGMNGIEDPRDSEIQVCGLFDYVPGEVEEVLEYVDTMGFDAANFDKDVLRFYDYLDPEKGKRLVEDLQENGIDVYGWTANSSREIERLKELGVDGIVSDYPDRI